MGKFYELYDSDAEIGIKKLSVGSVRTAAPSAADEQQAATASSREPAATDRSHSLTLVDARTRCWRSKMTAMAGRRARCGFPEGVLELYSWRFLELGHQVSQAAMWVAGRIVSAVTLLSLSTLVEI